MVINETSAFRKRVEKLLTDEEYTQFRELLILNPGKGAIIKGSGGIRKIRCRAKGQGQRGGARVIYYWAVAEDQILLLFIYAKNESDDLTRDQIRALARIIEEAYP